MSMVYACVSVGWGVCVCVSLWCVCECVIVSRCEWGGGGGGTYARPVHVVSRSTVSLHHCLWFT